MDLLLFLALIVIIAYLGTIYLFGRKGKLGIYTGGIEFLLIGSLLSIKSVFNIDEEFVRDLYPFVHVELAWIGLLYGVQIEWKNIRRHPPVDWAVMFSESVLTMILIFFASHYILRSVLIMEKSLAFFISLLLASAGSISSPWTLGVVHSRLKIRNPALRRLRFIVSIDDIPGIVVFSALFFLFLEGTWFELLLRFAGSVFAGLSLGWLSFELLCSKKRQFEPLIVLIGAVLLASGIAYALGVSVIFITFLSGLVIANRRNRHVDLYPLIAGVEHPFYVLFLLIAGFHWNAGNFAALYIAILAIAVRLIGKFIIFQASQKYYIYKEWNGKLALTIIAPGGIALAMIVNAALLAECFPRVDIALDVMVWALILLNPIGIPLAKFGLKTKRGHT